MRYAEIGVIVSGLAFISSFFAVASMDPYWRLVNMLAANPQHYINYVWSMLLYSILPLTVALILVVVGYKRERAYSTKILCQWPVAVIGGIFSVWGALRILLSLNAYSNALSTAHYQNIGEIDGLILTIYATTSVAAVLWLFTGILFIYLPLSNKLCYARSR